MLRAARRERLREWHRLLRDYAAWQTLVQAVTVLAGLIFVNLMSVHDYALYILGMSGLTILSIVCDLGLTNSLLYFRREAGERGVAFHRYIQAVLWLRRALLGALGPVFLLVFPWVAVHSGFDLGPAVGVALVAVAIVWVQTRSTTGLLVLRILGRYREAYRGEFIEGAARFLLALTLGLASWLSATPAVTINLVGAVLVALAVRRAFPPRGAHPVAGAERRALLRYIAPAVPNALHYAFQDQVIVWLSAVFGRTTTVAQVGALSRLALVIGLIAGLIPTLILPRLTPIRDHRLYLRRFLQFGCVLAMAGAALSVAAAEWPQVFLLVLGPHYHGLHSEVILIMVAAALSLLRGYCGSINQARGWIALQPLGLAALLAVQTALITTLPLSTTGGVLTFNLLSVAAGLGVQGAINAVGFWKDVR